MTNKHGFASYYTPARCKPGTMYCFSSTNASTTTPLVIAGYVYETSSSEFPNQTEIPLTYHSSVLAFLHDPQ